MHLKQELKPIFTAKTQRAQRGCLLIAAPQLTGSTAINKLRNPPGNYMAGGQSCFIEAPCTLVQGIFHARKMSIC
jgi:hypothetical protein